MHICGGNGCMGNQSSTNFHPGMVRDVRANDQSTAYLSLTSLPHLPLASPPTCLTSLPHLPASPPTCLPHFHWVPCRRIPFPRRGIPHTLYIPHAFPSFLSSPPSHTRPPLGSLQMIPFPRRNIPAHLTFPTHSPHIPCRRIPCPSSWRSTRAKQQQQRQQPAHRLPPFSASPPPNPRSSSPSASST